jgi:hypothetical protein
MEQRTEIGSYRRENGESLRVLLHIILSKEARILVQGHYLEEVTTQMEYICSLLGSRTYYCMHR